MCRKSEHESIPAFSLRNGAVMALGLLVLLFAFAMDAAAEKGQGNETIDPNQTNIEQKQPISIVQYVPQGYSLEGPRTILTVTKDGIRLFAATERKPVVLSLTGTSLSIRDQNNQALPFTALVQGALIYISRSPDLKTVILFVVPPIRRENNNV